MIGDRPWRPGDAVALREVRHGRIWSARPAIVVQDAGPERQFFVPAGMSWMCARRPGGTWLRLPESDPDSQWTLAPRDWDTNALSFAWPDVAHAVLVFWTADWAPRGWYVNLQEPLRPSPVGFDYMDHALDIVVTPDLSSWSWKDEDELDEAVAAGIYSETEARRFREEGERAIERLLERRTPFDRDWTTWRPDPSWPVPELPPGWSESPV
ncbi:MAG TPA: DUF402 domain-containing protein [Actinomycetota bacterium]